MDVSALEEKANILMQNVAGWENSVIERIGNRIKAIGEMSVADVKMLNNIATVKQDMQEIIKELAKVTGLNIREVLQIYGDTLAEQHLENNPLYDYRGKTFVPFAENTELQAIARAYTKTTAGTMLNLSKTKGLCVMNEHGRPIALKRYYTDILDKAVMQVASGATDFHSAMRQAITALGGSGVRVDYGGGITRRLDTVVRQTTLYGAKQASNEYNEMIGEELGCDGIEIDYHRNSRPSHRFMQGKQYSIEGDIIVKGVLYKDATKAGVIDALNDYNCYHFKTPIICGVSVPAYDAEQLKQYEAEDDEEFTIDGKTQNGYGWSQDMRKLETYMREQKRIKVAAQASGDKVLVKQCNERIKAAMAKYEQISEATGIRQDPSRFTIPRQPRTVKDALTSYNQSGIIKGNRAIENRQMANAGRRSKYHILTEEEIESLKDDIRAIGADESLFLFNEGADTYYSDKRDRIFVCGNVLPDLASTHPRDLMSSRAALAHEYYGHRAYRNTRIAPNSWNDEFRASYMAAKNTPNLSDEDRRYLILDALERAKESGVTIKYNDYIRRMLHG